MIRNAIPAHHKLSVRNQTIKATRAAGINMKSSRTRKMIIRPIIIKPMSPKRPEPISPNRSKPGKFKIHRIKVLVKHK